MSNIFFSIYVVLINAWQQNFFDCSWWGSTALPFVSHTNLHNSWHTDHLFCTKTWLFCTLTPAFKITWKLILDDEAMFHVEKAAPQMPNKDVTVFPADQISFLHKVRFFFDQHFSFFRQSFSFVDVCGSNHIQCQIPIGRSFGEKCHFKARASTIRRTIN